MLLGFDWLGHQWTYFCEFIYLDHLPKSKGDALWFTQTSRLTWNNFLGVKFLHIGNNHGLLKVLPHWNWFRESSLMAIVIPWWVMIPEKPALSPPSGFACDAPRSRPGLGNHVRHWLGQMHLVGWRGVGRMWRQRLNRMATVLMVPNKFGD